MKRIEMKGKRFGRWLVLEEVQKRNNKRAFQCLCDCGNEAVVMGDNLRSGNSTQCASCSAKIKGGLHGTHGKTGTEVYNIWRGIKLRCLIPSHPSYKNYGGRGITICDRWKNSFENFLEDMGPRPTSKHWIERRDNEGHYEPSNCYWALPVIQQQNKRNNVKLRLGKEVKTIMEWAQALGVHASTLYMRHRAGWSDEKVLITPIR